MQKCFLKMLQCLTLFELNRCLNQCTKYINDCIEVNKINENFDKNLLMTQEQREYDIKCELKLAEYVYPTNGLLYNFC